MRKVEPITESHKRRMHDLAWDLVFQNHSLIMICPANYFNTLLHYALKSFILNLFPQALVLEFVFPVYLYIKK